LIDELNGWPVNITGDSYQIIIESDAKKSENISLLLNQSEWVLGSREEIRDNKKLIVQKRSQPFEKDTLKELRDLDGLIRFWVITVYSPIISGVLESCMLIMPF